MRKCTPVMLAAFAAGLSLGAFPLEWNVNRKTGIPYEVEISRTKLNELAGVDKECGFKVTATTADGKKELAVQLLEGQRPGAVALRFTVPAGTTALDCDPVPGGQLSTAESLNLFAGTLSNTSKWKVSRKTDIKSADGKIVVAANSFGDSIITCTADIPAEFAGRDAKLELDFKSTAKETWPCYICIEQLDAAGKVLSESLTDPRWITLMRPSSVLTAHRENGRIHPDAKKLRLKITAQGVPHLYDSYGKIAKDKTIFLPKFEISRLAVRAADQLPFPKYRDEFFSAGISGAPGDFSFDTTSDSFNTKAFFFATHSQACWAEGKAITDTQELFYPAGDGTVEAWFKPRWSKRAKRGDFFCLFSADPAQYHGPMKEKKSNYTPCLELRYFPKAKSAQITFMDYTLKKYIKKFKCEIPTRKWSHVAVQWSEKKGIQVFVNGTLVFDDPKFTYTAVDFNKPSIRNAVERYISSTNEHMASQFTLGSGFYPARSNKFLNRHAPFFKGQIDLLRISSAPRYDKKGFVPSTKFGMDKDTRALFDFDRSFDGKSSGGIQFISGSVMSLTPRVDNKLAVNGKTVNYYPEKILDNNHPAKVLDKRNYTNVPDKEDFAVARKAEQVKFKFNGKSEKTVTLDAPVVMDYIEYANNGNKTVVHPFVRKADEIDPRSFGDIRDSMDISKHSARVRTNRIFQFMLSSSDYFMSYQARFNPGSDNVGMACYDALLMLNAYCGFECGPLNSMTANMFACAGSVPAGQTSGYGHSFQQAWVDGKSNLYDLSAQMFFPSMDNETPASLGDTEVEPGCYPRVQSGGDHFIRLGTRRYHANTPAFIERVAMSIRPGESLRMWYANDGKSNTLQFNNPARYNNHTLPYAKDVTALTNANKKNFPVSEVDHYFPEFGSAYLKFNNAPSKFASNFTDVKTGSFCYKVMTCYPIVYAEYAAKLADGSFAGLEISTDRGKTFRALPSDADGVSRLFYQVCARREYLIRVNAPMAKVANFSANTQMMTNTRVMTCKLAKGENKLVCSSDSGSDIDITLQYRKNVKDIEISGVTFSGAAVGFERIATVLAPEETKSFAVKGASDKAVVRTTGKITASLANGKLTVSAPADYKGVDTATIVDDGAEKQLIVITHPGIELVLADKITPVQNAERGKDFQPTVNFGGSNAKININFSSAREPGKYAVWTLHRMSADPVWTRVHVDLPQGGSSEIFRHANFSHDFYKSRFYGKNGRSKFRWDYPVEKNIPYPFQQIAPVDIKAQFSNLVFRYDNPSQELTEVAAVMIMPWPDREFNNELAKVLRGVNNHQWYVKAQNAEK
ncbi:MAG: hypothetical protein J6R00_05305 [Lentisphaeria bacterium]|nr:hypothetical protein [Lentisphaeria bacterium]